MKNNTHSAFEIPPPILPKNQYSDSHRSVLGSNRGVVKERNIGNSSTGPKAQLWESHKWLRGLRSLCFLTLWAIPCLWISLPLNAEETRSTPVSASTKTEKIANPPAPLTDLEDLSQDFVLETKKIEIPGYPGAFNPAIVRWGDTILMAFRIRYAPTRSTNMMGFVYLDKEFNPISTPKVLDIRVDVPYASHEHDPRLVVIGNRLYIVFSNIMAGTPGIGIRRMYVAELKVEGEDFHIENPECLTDYEGERKDRWEKNWVPFDYKQNLMLAYSLTPHRVLQPVGGGICDTAGCTTSTIRWNWGVLRGGTPALEIDGQYLAFFHSCKDMTTANSQGKHLIHYFMGAYTFSSEPPFEITKISPKPIVSRGFYSSPFHRTWKPLRVVFPCGLVADDKHLWVSYGRQDHEMWIAKIDKVGLLKSLTPVKVQP